MPTGEGAERDNKIDGIGDLPVMVGVAESRILVEGSLHFLGCRIRLWHVETAEPVSTVPSIRVQGVPRNESS